MPFELPLVPRAREAATPAAFEAMWDRIDSEIAKPAEAVQRDKRVESEAVENAGGLFSAIGSWLDRYRSQVFTGLASAAAGGCIGLVCPSAKHGCRACRGSSGSRNRHQPPDHGERSTHGSREPRGYDGSGIVFTIPAEGEDGSPTSVIWLLPPEDSEEGPI